MNKRPDGIRELIVGSSGCGKTSLIVQRMKNQKRLLVMDYQGQFSQIPGFDWTVVRDPFELQDILDSNRKIAKLQICYQPIEREYFVHFCKVGMAWGKAKPCTVVVDEAPLFLSTGRAKKGWDLLVNTSRKLGINVICAGQRLTEMDTSIRNQASNLYVFRLKSESDKETLVREFGIDREKLPTENFKYIKEHNGKVTSHTAKKIS